MAAPDKTTVRGNIRDKTTGEPLAWATIYLEGTSIGTTSDERGDFALTYSAPKGDKKEPTVVICYVGFNDLKESIKPGQTNTIRAALTPTAYQVEEVKVKVKRKKYNKRNNPAFDLALRLIQNRERNDPRNIDYLNYQQYEKIVVSMGGITTTTTPDMRARQKRRIEFNRLYADTSKLDKKPILPLTIKEQISTINYDKKKATTSTTLNHTRSLGVDSFMSQESVMSYLRAALTGINVFDGDIHFMQRHFTGPLSKVATAYYKYYIRDTVLIDGVPHIDLEFVPRNQESLGFVGHMFVAADSTDFIRRIEINVPSQVNLNFIKNLIFTQEFARGPNNQQLLISDNAIVETAKLGNEKIQAQRYLSNQHYSFIKPIAEQSTEKPSDNQPLEIWRHLRHTPATAAEDKMVDMLAQLRKKTGYKVSEKLMQILIDGYIETGRQSRFDIGPVLSFLGGNSLEGTRLNVGGFTTAKLMPKLFFEGYLGYGTLDQKFKYNVSMEYSFNKKEHHPQEFPIKSIKLETSYDVDKLGRLTDKEAKENVMSWLQRRADSSITYLRQSQITFTHEFKNHFSYAVTARHYTQHETALMRFAQNPAWSGATAHGSSYGTPDEKRPLESSHKSYRAGIYNDFYGNIHAANPAGGHRNNYAADHRAYAPTDHLTTPDFGHNFGTGYGKFSMSELEVKLRFAPGEKLYQTKNRRYRISKEAPVFTLSHRTAIKGVLGSAFTSNRTEFFFTKRFTFAPFGYIDAQARAGAQWNTVPYILLPMPDVNMSYVINEGAYALMNPMEFAWDKYCSIDVSYFLDGLIFNRIPFLKKLGLREILTFRAVWGHLSNHNNPAHNTALPALPSYSHVMNKGPYMEAGVGIENILKIFRVDYVRRINYLNHKGIDKNGVQVTARFKF